MCIKNQNFKTSDNFSDWILDYNSFVAAAALNYYTAAAASVWTVNIVELRGIY